MIAQVFTLVAVKANGGQVVILELVVRPYDPLAVFSLAADAAKFEARR